MDRTDFYPKATTYILSFDADLSSPNEVVAMRERDLEGALNADADAKRIAQLEYRGKCDAEEQARETGMSRKDLRSARDGVAAARARLRREQFELAMAEVEEPAEQAVVELEYEGIQDVGEQAQRARMTVDEIRYARARLRRRNVPPLSASRTHEFARGQAPVYNVLGDSRELGERSVRGHIRVLQERVDYPPGHEFGDLRGNLVIETSDDDSLEAAYAGVFRLGREWHWLNAAAATTPGNQELVKAENLRAKAFISMQFEVGSTKYAWLARYQCIGYGHVNLAFGNPLSVTFDVYTLGPQL
jgi:hypothetical protein